MDNQSKLSSSKEVIAYLAECFPLCFKAEGEARPLKIGIFKDLVERLPETGQVSKTQLRSALRSYTSSWRYLYGVKPGAKRVDLDGNDSGELEQQHIDHARKQLEEAKARRASQKGQESTDQRKKTYTATKFSGNKVKSHENFNKARHSSAKNISSRSARSDKAQNSSKPVTISISQLQIGQNILIKVGKNTVNASILEIVKGGVRVQLFSGLIMIVRAEHLRF